MCGIIAAISLDGHPINEEVYNQFQDQSGRGRKGFGIAMLEKPIKQEDKPYIKVRRSTDEIGAIIDLKLFPTTMIMFHHRTPTSSDNKIQQTHPILVSNEILEFDWLISHNGIITNDAELKIKHEKEYGIKYSTDNGEIIRNYNDSEALAVELAIYLEREQLKKNWGVEQNEIQAKGSAAVIGMQIDKITKQPLKLFYGRNTGNILHTFRDQRIIFISSEGKGQMVTPNEYTFIDLQHPKLKQKTYQLIVPYVYPNITYPKIEHTKEFTHVNNTPIESQETKYWQDTNNYLETTDELEKSFNLTDDPNLIAESELMYDELNINIEEFMEMICNQDECDYADCCITEINKTMKKMQEKMQNYWTKNILTKEEEEEKRETNKTIIEATRDKTITPKQTALQIPDQLHSQCQTQNINKPTT